MSGPGGEARIVIVPLLAEFEELSDVFRSIILQTGCRWRTELRL